MAETQNDKRKLEGKLKRQTKRKVFWHVFLSEFRTHQLLSWFIGFTLLYSVGFGVFGANEDPWFPYAAEINDFVLSLFYSIIAGYIFYLFAGPYREATQKAEYFHQSQRTLEIIANQIGMFFFYCGLDVGPSNQKSWPKLPSTLRGNDKTLDAFFKHKKLTAPTEKCLPRRSYHQAIMEIYSEIRGRSGKYQSWVRDPNVKLEIEDFLERFSHRHHDPDHDHKRIGFYETATLANYYGFGSMSPSYLVSSFEALNKNVENIYGVKPVNIEYVQIEGDKQN